MLSYMSVSVCVCTVVHSREGLIPATVTPLSGKKDDKESVSEDANVLKQIERIIAPLLMMKCAIERKDAERRVGCQAWKWMDKKKNVAP